LNYSVSAITVPVYQFFAVAPLLKWTVAFAVPSAFGLAPAAAPVPIEGIAIIAGFSSFNFSIAAQKFESVFIVNIYAISAIDADPLGLHFAEIVTAVPVSKVSVITNLSLFWFKYSVSTAGSDDLGRTLGRETR
jgi:hypothetical protein